MTLTNSTVSKNTALGGHRRGEGPSGGGIVNYGTMRIINTTVTGNKASEDGGGIRNQGIMTLKGSTVTGNRAKSGGGIYSGHFLRITPDFLTLTNSTVSGNQGDGIFNRHSLTLVHATLSDNLGAGLRNTGAMTLTNSLIANSIGAGDCINDNGTLVTRGINVVEDGSCGATISGDPKLGALLHNGGSTATHALSSTSPALDAADPTLCPAVDQRGIIRPQPAAGACDVGAFERLTTVSQDLRSLITFFRTAVNNGGLVGTGQDGLMLQRLKALRQQLLSAGHYKSRNLATTACDQLRRTLKHIDPNSTPDADDYVTGSEAGTFAGKIKALLTPWSCQ
jgi:hypothetical protein